MTSRDLRNFIGNDIIGTLYSIGNIHAVQVTKYQWVAFMNAEDGPNDGIVCRNDRAHCVKENMGGHRIYQITDDSDEVISGGTRKELIKNLNNHHPSWWILYGWYWT